MQVGTVVRVVRRTGHLLAESLAEYWPTEGDCEISERNISLHLAVALREAGFVFYGEAHTSGGTDQRTDLFALHPETDTTIVVECKRLYGAEGCGRMIHDLGRVREFVPRGPRRRAPSFGALLATTWDDRIAQWWSTRDATSPTRDARWQALDAGLRDAHWGSVVLQGYNVKLGTAEQLFHYLLYVVFERHSH